MSATVHTNYEGIGKHFKTRFGAAICGIAIAVTAVGAIVVTNQKDTSVGTGPVVIVDSGTRAINAAPVPVTYFLVATQEEANALQMKVSQDQYETIMSGKELSPGLTIYLAIDTPDKEAMLGLMMQELNAYALETGMMTTQVLDLRAEPLGPISIVPLEPEIEAMPPSEALGESFSPCTAEGVDDYKRLELAVFAVC